jgi:hypothetical protein
MDFDFISFLSAEDSGGDFDGMKLRITSEGHGLRDGDWIRITDVVGMTELNNNYYVVADAVTDTFTLKNGSDEYIDGTDYADYISDGLIWRAYNTFSSLEHLEGEEVQVLGDGTYRGTFTVTDGDVTLPSPAANVIIGIGYDSMIQTMDLEEGSQTGTAQGKVMQISRVMVRLLESQGCKVGDGTTMDDQVTGEETELFSGDVELPFPSGSNKNKYVYISQNKPLPFHCLGIFPKTLVSD